MASIFYVTPPLTINIRGEYFWLKNRACTLTSITRNQTKNEKLQTCISLLGIFFRPTTENQGGYGRGHD